MVVRARLVQLFNSRTVLADQILNQDGHRHGEGPLVVYDGAG